MVVEFRDRCEKGAARYSKLAADVTDLFNSN